VRALIAEPLELDDFYRARIKWHAAIAQLDVTDSYLRGDPNEHTIWKRSWDTPARKAVARMMYRLWYARDDILALRAYYPHLQLGRGSEMGETEWRNLKHPSPSRGFIVARIMHLRSYRDLCSPAADYVRTNR
jgi:hypothetical protein